MNSLSTMLRSLLLLLPVVAWGGMLAMPGGAAKDAGAYRLLNLAPMRLSFEFPQDWKLDDSDAESLHLVQLYGPWKRRLEHPRITLFHYGPDSGYSSKAEFIRRRLKGVSASEILVGGVKAESFTLSFVDTLGIRSTDLHREPVQENYVLLDAPQGGFYVFTYHAAQAIYKSNYPAFERLLATAKFPKS